MPSGSLPRYFLSSASCHVASTRSRQRITAAWMEERRESSIATCSSDRGTTLAESSAGGRIFWDGLVIPSPTLHNRQISRISGVASHDDDPVLHRQHPSRQRLPP